MTVAAERPDHPAVDAIGPVELAFDEHEVAELGIAETREQAATLVRTTHGVRRLVLLARDEEIAPEQLGSHPEVVALADAWLSEVGDWSEQLLELALAEGPALAGRIPAHAERWRPLAEQLGVASWRRGVVELVPAFRDRWQHVAQERFGPARCEAIRRSWLRLAHGVAAVVSVAPVRVESWPCRFSLELLGSPRLVRWREEVGWESLSIGAPAAWLVLARLALAGGRAVAIEELVEAVRDGEESRAPEIHPILSRLRGQLGDPGAILRADGGYRLGPQAQDWWIDLRELERASVAVAAQEPADAALVRLEGVRLLGDGNVLEGIERRWLVGPRRRARERRLEARLRLAELLERCGRAEAALDVLTELIELDATNERAFADLMRVYGGMGRRDAVHRCYADLCTVLADELGVVPSPATTAQYHQLLGG